MSAIYRNFYNDFRLYINTISFMGAVVAYPKQKYFKEIKAKNIDPKLIYGYNEVAYSADENTIEEHEFKPYAVTVDLEKLGLVVEVSEVLISETDTLWALPAIAQEVRNIRRILQTPKPKKFKRLIDNQLVIIETVLEVFNKHIDRPITIHDLSEVRNI